MTEYTLQINIDQTGLQSIYNAEMAVALLQPQYRASYQIVSVLAPATSMINISWNDSLSVYSSSYSLQAYNVLRINSQSPALSGQVFTFDGHFISQSGTTTLPQTIQLQNGSGGMVTAGLARTFWVNSQPNGTAILGATSLLNGGLGTFSIDNQILLTLLSGAQVGMAIPTRAFPNFPVASARAKMPESRIAAQTPLLLEFSSGNPTQTAYFNSNAGVFIST